MLRRCHLASALLSVLCQFSLLNAIAQSTPPMIVQVPFTSVGAGDIVAGTSSTSKATACTGYADSGGNNYGDGCLASQVGLSAPWGVVVDKWGNVYFSDEAHLYVRVIYAGATVNGVTNPATAMIQAANTSLSIPGTLVAGDVYGLAGGLTSVMSGICNGGATALNTNGSGCPATDSYIKGPYSPAVDSAGNVFIPDKSNSVVYVVLANATGLAAQLVTLENPTVTTPKVGYIYQIAGHGGGWTDNALANNAGQIHGPYSIAVDASENLYIADETNDAVRMVNGPNNSTSGGVAAGFIHTIAGAGYCGTASCTGTPTPLGTSTAPASNAAALGSAFSLPGAVAVDGSGNVYVADNSGGTASVYTTVRVIYAGGTNNPLAHLIFLETGVASPTANYVYTLAGDGVAGSPGKGAGLLATASGVSFDRIVGLGLDSHNNLYIMDYGSHSELAEVNAETGYLAFLSADGLTTSGTAFTASGVYCASGTSTGSGPTTLDKYGDGCPAPQTFTSNAEGNIGIDPSGNFYYADSGNNLVRKLTFNSNFPATTVGGTAPTQNLAFLLLTGNTGDTVSSLSTASVATQGKLAGSEFAKAGTGDSCSGSTTLAPFLSSSTNVANDVCVVPLTFTPAAAGSRSGAVQISGTIGGSSQLLVTVYLSGIGNGSALAIDPGASSTLGSGSNPAGVATDSAGNVYVAYRNGTVYRTPNGGGTPVEIGSGLGAPHQLAIDGAGNLFVADSGTSQIVEFAGASTSSSVITGTALVTGLTSPEGVAVDASGNLYIAESGNVLVQPIGSGELTTLGSSFTTPVSVAVDAAGNVYVADSGLREIVKLAIANGSVTQSPMTLLPGAEPVSVAVDAAGDLYYGDVSLGEVVEVPVTGTTAAVASGFASPAGVALDPGGNLYVADTSSISGITFDNRTAAQLPAIQRGTTSNATITNIGNGSYTGGISGNSDATVSTDFTFATGSSNGCSSPTSPLLILATGNNCELAVSANTSTATDTATFTGGATLALTSQPSVLINTTAVLSIPATIVAYGTAITGTVTVTPASGSVNPTGTVNLLSGSTPLGSCSLQNAGGATSTCNFSLTGVSVGTPTITAIYAGDGLNFAASPASNGISVTVAQISTTTTLYVNLASIMEGLVFTGTASVSPAPDSGTVLLYLDGSSTVATTCTLSSGSCSWTLGGVAIGAHSLRAIYGGSTNYAPSIAGSTPIAVTAPPQAAAVATGDTRTVTEPSIPATCTQLTAALTSVNDDLPASVDAAGTTAVTNPDGARIQSALNTCSASYPGTGPGLAVRLSIDGAGHNAYLTGPLVMPSNVTLLVDPGVYVYFSRNAQDYDTVPGTHTCGNMVPTGQPNANATANCHPLIDIPGTSSANGASTNVAIMGFGKLDGRGGDPLLNAIPPYQGFSWWGLSSAANGAGSQQNPRFFQMDTGSSNITLYKITLRNSPLFHISTTGAVTGFTAWDIKIITPTTSRNTDGIDPGNAQNFTITRSWVSDGDDNIAVGASGTTAPAANISVTNNHFFAGHGESIGSYTGAGVSNILFDSNMLSGNAAVDSNSTGLRLKSGYDRGGLVTNVQFSNSCFQNHKSDIVFSPNYENTTGTLLPNFNNILLQNLTFLPESAPNGTAGSIGSEQYTGTSSNGAIFPLQVTLDNVSFASTLSASSFSPAPTNVALTYGPGLVSSNFINGYATFTGANGDTATNNITVANLFPPACNFTAIAPELTGPAGLPQTITAGQTATAIVILTPAVGGAAYPTGTVTLTDALTSSSTTVTLTGTTDNIVIPLTGLSAGTHTFTATYSGDSFYTGASPYSTAGPYVITVNAGSLASTTTVLSGVPATSPYGNAFTATATVTGSTPTGTVQFVVNGVVYATATLSSSVATASINLPYSTTAYSITAIYGGDSANAGSTSSPSSLTVTSALTSTALSASSTTSTLGHPVLLTATVTTQQTGVGTPSGPLTFTYTNAAAGITSPATIAAVTLTNGVAYASVDLPVGANIITANFPTSGSFFASASTTLTVTVTATAILPLPNAPIALPYTITTIAGGGASNANTTCAGSTDAYGDGCQATSVYFALASNDLRTVAADPFGNVYFPEESGNIVRRIAPNGIITNFAGKISGTACIPPPVIGAAQGSGCTPTLVSLSNPRGVQSDANGNIFIAGYSQDKIFEVRASDGLMYLVAGTGAANSTGYGGDGGPATLATFTSPRGVTADRLGNVYIASTGEYKIRKIDTFGNVQTIAGTGSSGSTGNGGPATSATLSNPQDVLTDANLNVYIADNSQVRVLCVTCGTGSPLDHVLSALGISSPQNGYLYAIAGGAASTYTGSFPTLSTNVTMGAQKLAMDTGGNLYISDGSTISGVSTGAVWFLDMHTGTIRPMAGYTTANCAGTYGDGCHATQAAIGVSGSLGIGVGADPLGNIYISDTKDMLIRKVVTGLASTATATGATSSRSVQIHFAAGDNLASSNALAYSSTEWSLGTPACTTNTDSTVDCLLSSSFTPAVPGLRSTPLAVNSSLGSTSYLSLAGTGLGAGTTLDPASQSTFGSSLSVAGLATDNAGYVYVSDATSKMVYRFTPTAIANGSAATGTTLATLAAPGGLAVDPRGYVYAADTSTGLITQISPSGTVSTLPFSFTTPAGLAADGLNNLYVSDASAQAVYQINPITGGKRTLNLGSLVSPAGLAIDPSSNLLVADPGARALYRFSPTGTRTTVTTSAVAPFGVVTDAAGNLLIADTAQILAVPASSNSSSFTAASLTPAALAIDFAGNLYTGASGSVLKLGRTQGAVQFSGPSAAPQTISVMDSGNQPAQIASLNQSDALDYTVNTNASMDCVLGSSPLATAAVGGVCAVTASYTPTTYLPTTDTVFLTGNFSNAALSLPSSMQFVLTGPATPPASTVTFNPTSPATPIFGQTVTVSVQVGGASLLATGGVIFTVDGVAGTSIPLNSGAASATLTGLTGGTHSVSAAYTSTNGYASSTSSISLAVGQASQTITFAPAVTSYTYSPTGTFSLSATSTSGLAVSFASTTSGVCTVSGTTATIVSAGTCTIQATQAGNANYSAATAVPVSYTIGQASQTITFAPAVTSYTYSPTGTFSLSATSTSGLAVSFASTTSGVCTVSGTTATIVSAGTCTIQATQAGNSNYSAATAVPVSYTIGQASQAITFAPAVTSYPYSSAGTFSLSATSTSGLAVSFASTTSGVCTVSGTTATIVSAGTCTIQATQAGNGNYKAAAPVSVSYTIGIATPAVTVASSSSTALSLNPVTFTASVTSRNGTPTGTVTFLDGAAQLGTVTLASGAATLTTSSLAIGTHTITVAYSGDTNFAATASAALTETIIDISIGTPGTTGPGAGTGAAQTVTPGGTAVYSLPITPSNGTTFPVALTLSVSGLPPGATAVVAPSSWVQSTTLPWTWTLAANTALSGNTQLSIQLPLTTATAQPEGRKLASGLAPMALALLLLPFAGKLRRTGKRLGQIVAVFLLLAAGMAAMAGMSGCGGGFFGQAQKTYPLTVTVTAGALAHSTTVTLTVQ
jgi:sugar lactone lactonase YvrE